MSSAGVKIGRVIRANRTRRGLSQEGLAAMAGINRSYLGEIERGEAVASIDTLQKLADALGERLSVLVSEYEANDGE